MKDALSGGSRLSRPEGMVADATSASLPARHFPSKNSVHASSGNRATVLFVTVCSHGRLPVLANHRVHRCVVAAWERTDSWLVGRYVIMPDHMHFFCAPALGPPSSFHGWMARWKALVSRTFPVDLRRLAGKGRFRRPNGEVADATSASLPETGRVLPVFQRNCWDVQLRAGDNYTAKWGYVRDNPVRKGLVATADDWAYQGELNVLHWHEK